MKFNNNKTRQRGSILVICMVLAGLGTIGVAAWASLLDARTHEAEQSATALDRRVRYGNSIGLAREVIYQRYLHANRGPTSDDEIYSLENDWGLVEIDAWTDPVFGYDATTRINKTGAVPNRAFSLDVDVTVDDGDYLHDFTYQLKSYSPLLGGDLITVHKNVETGDEFVEVTGDLKVEGRMKLWNAEYKSSATTTLTDAVLAAGKTLPKLPFKNSSDANVLPSNFPFVAQTSGAVGGSAEFSGKLNVVNNTGTPSNSYVAKIIGYGSGTYVALDGSSSSGSGSGADTNPATADDAAVLAIILGGGYISENLAPYAPLSSTNLKMILADTSLNESEMASIMADNQPLPDDTLGNVVQSPVLTATTENSVLEAAGYHVFTDFGRVVVNLNSATLPHMIINNVGEVEFIGQPDDASATALEAEEPRIIAIVNDPGVELRRLDFRDLNRRRIIVGAHNSRVASNSSSIVSFSGVSTFPDWHMLLELEGIRTKWDMSAIGGVRIYGGIRTDQLVNAKNGSLTIRKEPNVDVLETMASRTAWIETIRK
ncbi:hypothetical protein N8615_02015 [Verrucomicrobiales bacterium]|nr:hypothetical protein [Verrucomicrobiales bacterium]